MVSGMLTLKASAAAAVLTGTAVVSAAAGYAISRATLTAQVTITCPQTTTADAHAAPQSRAFPPLGNLLPTTGGQKF